MVTGAGWVGNRVTGGANSVAHVAVLAASCV
jgi:hypothetical protein